MKVNKIQQHKDGKQKVKQKIKLRYPSNENNCSFSKVLTDLSLVQSYLKIEIKIKADTVNWQIAYDSTLYITLQNYKTICISIGKKFQEDIQPFLCFFLSFSREKPARN